MGKITSLKAALLGMGLCDTLFPSRRHSTTRAFTDTGSLSPLRLLCASSPQARQPQPITANGASGQNVRTGAESPSLNASLIFKCAHKTAQVRITQADRLPFYYPREVLPRVRISIYTSYVARKNNWAEVGA